MTIDWNVYGEAIRLATSSCPKEGLARLESLDASAESEVEQASLLLGKSTCYAQLHDWQRSLALLDAAKRLATTDRQVQSQVAFSEANCVALLGDNQRACVKYAEIEDKYRDLLADPQNNNFAAELRARHGCALVHANRPGEAIPLLRPLLASDQYDDVQRVQLYLGAALAAVGEPREAQMQLVAAARGANQDLSKQALDHLTALSSKQ
jgi:tetratricopeptide (TPR) repeat protein